MMARLSTLVAGCKAGAMAIVPPSPTASHRARVAVAEATWRVDYTERLQESEE